MNIAKTKSSLVVIEGSKEFIELEDILSNYIEWSFKPREIPEVVAAEFAVSLCPSLSLNRVIKMFFDYAEKSEHGQVDEETFLLDYVRTNEILADRYLNDREC